MLDPTFWGWPRQPDNTVTCDWTLEVEVTLEKGLSSPIILSLQSFLGDSYEIRNTSAEYGSTLFKSKLPDMLVYKKPDGHANAGWEKVLASEDPLIFIADKKKNCYRKIKANDMLLAHLLSAKQAMPNKRTLGILIFSDVAVAYQFFGPLLVRAYFHFQDVDTAAQRLFELIHHGFLLDVPGPESSLRIGSFGIVQCMKEGDISYARKVGYKGPNQLEHERAVLEDLRDLGPNIPQLFMSKVCLYLYKDLLLTFVLE